MVLVPPTHGWLDYASFYTAGHLAFTRSVLDLEAVIAFQRSHGLPLVPFLYPPAVALAYIPFTWLPYVWSAVFHLLVQLVILFAAAIAGARVFEIPKNVAILGTLGWMPAAIGVITGQNSALLLLLVVLTAAALKSVDEAQARGASSSHQQRIAGIVTGAASYRPHLGLPLVLLSLWRGARGSFLIAIALIALQYVMGVIATGGMLDWPLAWLSTVRAETGTDFAVVGWQVLGLPGLLSHIAPTGTTASSVLYVGGLVIGLAIVFAMREPLRRWDAPSAVALTCALALFGGLRGWAYDATILLPGLALIARDARQRGWPHPHRLVTVGAYGLALTTPLGALVGFNPTAVCVLAAPFVLAFLRTGAETPRPLVATSG